MATRWSHAGPHAKFGMARTLWHNSKEPRTSSSSDRDGAARFQIGAMQTLCAQRTSFSRSRAR
eukprot:792624-Prorocentrum_lima.AAC.1